MMSRSSSQFEDLAFRLYSHQSQNNKIYNRFLDILGRLEAKPSSLEDIPLCPISVFKRHPIKTGNWSEENVFMSSGTGDSTFRSKHFVKDLSHYNLVAELIFQSFYTKKDYEIFALLPSYLENGNSSLVQMVSHLMDKYNGHRNNFFLYNHKDLKEAIQSSQASHKILIGVTFALIDFAHDFPIEDPSLSVMFTGGMKNRKQELSFELVYDILNTGFPLSSIDAEYGMTEMFSQSYALNTKKGEYQAGKSIRILSKDLNDALDSAPQNKVGQLGFIDLANVDSLAFVLTDDLCLLKENQVFQVLGRRSESDLRGCTLMYEGI